MRIVGGFILFECNDREGWHIPVNLNRIDYVQNGATYPVSGEPIVHLRVHLAGGSWLSVKGSEAEFITALEASVTAYAGLISQAARGEV